MTVSTPFFNYKAFHSHFRDELIDAFDNVLSNGAFILQDDLVRFESRLSQYTCASVVGVANATDGLEMIFASLPFPPGSEVIISTHTMCSTASAILSAGYRVVPVDIQDDGLISPEAIKSAITSETKAICVTDLNGKCCDFNSIIPICQSHDLVLIEDSAQGLGSFYDSQHSGTFGYAGVFSFYPAKTLGCLGDGGAIITSSSELAHSFALCRDHGRVNGECKSLGRNSRLDNLQAAFLNVFFDNFSIFLQRRREIASMYKQAFASIPQIVLPSEDSSKVCSHSYQNFECIFDERDALRTFLSQNNVGSLVQWNGQLIHHVDLPGIIARNPCIKAEQYINSSLMLPCNSFLSDDQVSHVIQTVLNFYS